MFDFNLRIRQSISDKVRAGYVRGIVALISFTFVMAGRASWTGVCCQIFRLALRLGFFLQLRRGPTGGLCL